MGDTRTSMVFAVAVAGVLAVSRPGAAAFDDVSRPALKPPAERASLPPDPAAASQREAAEQGDAAAQFALGGHVRHR